MKVKALINYYDKDLKRDIKAGVIYEVESEERLKELLGANDKKLICCEVLKEAETEDNLSENKVSEDSSNVDTLPTDEVVEDKASTDNSSENTVEVTENPKANKKKSNAKKK